MIKINSKISAICILVMIFSQHIYAQKAFTLTGTVKNVPDVQIRLLKGSNLEAPTVLATTTIKAGSFTISGTLEHETFVSLAFQENQGDIYYIIPLALDSGKTSLTADTKDFLVSPTSVHPIVYPKVTTTAKVTKEYQSYLDAHKEFMKTKNAKELKEIIDEYTKKYSDGGEPSDSWYDKYDMVLEKVSVDFKTMTAKSLKKLDNSLAGIMLLNNVDLSVYNTEEMTTLLKGYKKGFGSTPQFKSLETNMNKFLKLAIGAMAPDFTLKNQNGEDVSLSQFKGKHVLVDFWTFWCGPCIAEFPHLEKLRKKYADQGFEILAVHGDKDKAEWLKALKEHNPSWPQIFDATAFDGNSVSDLYNVNAFPTGFLIDPAGKIIGRDLYAGALDKALLKIFKK